MSGVDELFEQLRREYLAEAPARLAELRKDLAAVRSGEADAARSLAMRFHRLAGSGGSYGFPAISQIGAEAERWLKRQPPPDDLDRAEEWIAGLAKAFDDAALAVGLPGPSPTRRLAFGWRAAVVGDPSDPLTARVKRSLEDARYTVSHHPPEVEPGGIPVSERPDLAVLALAPPARSAGVVARWTAPGPTRPTSVVLVGEVSAAEALVPPWSGLDDVVPAGRVETDLAAWARSIGWSADAPPMVLVLEPDRTHARSIRSAIERAGGRVTLVTTPAEVDARLRETAPDLVVMDWRPPGTTGPALLGLLRRSSPRGSIPVVALAAQPGDEERVAAIRAGADDLWPRSAPPTRVAAMIMARVEWSRRRQTRVRHDALTGLLSPASMMEELGMAAAAARRAAEPFGLILLDLDHFKRVNDRYGHAVGNQLLAEVAATIQGLVRSSDSIARVSGEELGILIRRSTPEDCAALADKLRAAVSSAAVKVGEVLVRAQASAGVACFPQNATDGPELFRAAARALARAKAQGRDRTVVSD